MSSLEDKYIPEPNTGCWIWTGWSDVQGYGRIKRNGKAVGAHRVMYQKHVGVIPEGKIVCHKCDNKWCVNPDHLYAGTYSNNMQDAYDRGQKGKPNNSRIPDDVIRQIRIDRANGMHYKTVMQRHGVSRSTVHKVCSGGTRYEVQ